MMFIMSHVLVGTRTVENVTLLLLRAGAAACSTLQTSGKLLRPWSVRSMQL